MIDGVSRPVMEVSSGNLYELDRILRGTIFGQVNLAVKIHRTHDGVYSRVMPLQYYAIKVYFRHRLQELQGRTQENPFQEIAAMQYVGNDNENVMGQIECCSDRENIYSVMDFSDGDELFDVVDRNGPFNEETAKRLFYQLLKGTTFSSSFNSYSYSFNSYSYSFNSSSYSFNSYSYSYSFNSYSYSYSFNSSSFFKQLICNALSLPLPFVNSRSHISTQFNHNIYIIMIYMNLNMPKPFLTPI